MKKIIIALCVLLPLTSFAKSIEISEIKDCGAQEVTMSGPAFGFEHAIWGTRGIEVKLDGEILTGVMTGDSFKTESWTKTMRVNSGNHNLSVVIYDGLNRTNILSEDEAKFQIESCKQVSKPAEVVGTKVGSSLKYRCNRGFKIACLQLEVKRLRGLIAGLTK